MKKKQKMNQPYLPEFLYGLGSEDEKQEPDVVADVQDPEVRKYAYKKTNEVLKHAETLLDAGKYQEFDRYVQRKHSKGSSFYTHRILLEGDEARSFHAKWRALREKRWLAENEERRKADRVDIPREMENSIIFVREELSKLIGSDLELPKEQALQVVRYMQCIEAEIVAIREKYETQAGKQE
ncbi:MAG: hypothetical protein ACUZ8H_00600 [Candidatus Anammoxibacter sp.]